MLMLPLLLGAADYSPPTIDVPDDIARNARPFLHAIATGNQAEAAKYVSNSAEVELDEEFADLQKLLAAAPPLTPRFTSKHDFSTREHHEVEEHYVYAGQKGGKWTRADLQFLRYDNEPLVIENWSVDHTAPYPPEMAALQQIGSPFFYMIFGGLALVGLIGLALLIWIARKKPALISPEIEADARARAVSTRES